MNMTCEALIYSFGSISSFVIHAGTGKIFPRLPFSDNKWFWHSHFGTLGQKERAFCLSKTSIKDINSKRVRLYRLVITRTVVSSTKCTYVDCSIRQCNPSGRDTVLRWFHR